MTDHPEAAHAASELDDYAEALPEAGGIVLVVVGSVVVALVIGALAVFA